MDARAGVVRSVDVSPSSPAAARVVLAAANVATEIAREQVPAAKDLFVLSVVVVEAVKAADRVALRFSVDGIGALIDELPDDATWDGCRGHLNAVRELAWLLLRVQSLNRAPLKAGSAIATTGDL